MEVILTHENADFDAIASLLAAAKLRPGAKPVLPRRINRNVRHFITLYWDVLPFIRPADLPRRGRITKVTLVDTQGLASQRGMDRHPNVLVIDHHAVSDDLNPGWVFEGDAVGATVTLLVERFLERGIQPTPIEATLMLLGIYEDTGSLSYSTTTARDLRCAAWLLEHRADMGLLVRFLHHPLSDEQRTLYEQLQGAAELHQFDGQSVVVAAVTAAAYVEEISTLAHKMRDLYEPSALFLLVQLEQHIQLVSRSTVDTIDVGAVAAHFGGGGHARAAAAIIKDMDLSQARQELLRILPDHVMPLLTVAEIMSHGLETLSVDATINEAHERVVRFGYEGYPVVDQGKVVGLLTRRAIDRALQHKLGSAAVGRFMTLGDVSVRPDDSISILQSVMMEHGWGQIPVVSPDDGRIMGIVTRTDVIKLWEPRPRKSELDEVRARLETLVPGPLLELIRKVSQVAQEIGVQIYLVGGLVRDLLLGISNMDIDIVVEGDAIALARLLVKSYGGRIRTHGRFGTAKWLLEGDFWELRGVDSGEACQLPKTIDFVTARTEFYESPTALPQVAQGSIKGDLHRRDFTINTLAIRLNPHRFGELLDFYGGKRDLDSGVIRVLHSLSFIDDPTRILRAVRFEQRLDFQIEPRTEELMNQSVALLDRITGDRIRHELEQLLREPSPERGFARLNELGVLAQIHPALSFDDWAEERFVRLREVLQEPEWNLAVDEYLVELAHFGVLTFRMDMQSLEALERRLRVRRATVEHVGQLHALRGDFERLMAAETPTAAFEILQVYSRQALLMAYVAADSPVARELLGRYVCVWARVKPATTGRELIALGLPPGPLYGEVLEKLLFARLDGRITTDEEERTYLEQLLDR